MPFTITRASLFLVFCTALVFPAAAETPAAAADSEAVADSPAGEDLPAGYESPADSPSEPVEKKHPLIAVGEILFTNLLLTNTNSYLFNFPWALPTIQSVRDNFTVPWQWEDVDGFKVNQLGHPYQGGVYFNAGRANGFNFYQSLAFSAFGSAAWETFGEAQHAAVNDMITTTLAAAPLGEMTHRLFLNAYGAGVPLPLAFLISPMDGLNLLLNRGSIKASGGNLYECSFYAGAAYSNLSYEEDGGKSLYSFAGFSGDLGFSVIYGDPFDQQSSVPYEHFELNASFGTNVVNHIDIRVISDGYLFSFSPVYTDSDALSTGLSLHFDFISLGELDKHDSTIDQSSTALDYTVKYRHLIREGLALSLKAHAGLTFMGVSDYYSPYTEDKSLKNYGLGSNAKLFFDLESQKLGRLSLSLFHYYLLTVPKTTAVSSGAVYWIFADISGFLRISEHVSIGMANSFILEKGGAAELPAVRKLSNTVKTFVRWNL
jgi:hypothetical protein